MPTRGRSYQASATAKETLVSKSSTELDANPAVGKSAVQRLVMLPCPFCGEDDDLYAYDYSPCWCGKCGASAGSIGKLKKDQVDIWNKRAT